MGKVTGKVFRLPKAKTADMAEPLRVEAQELGASHNQVVQVFEAFRRQRVGAVRVRCHGHLHLGQFLYTGKDFMIIDFEGESTRPMSERRRKRSALRDVAAMAQSFHYAAHLTLREMLTTGAL